MMRCIGILVGLGAMGCSSSDKADGRAAKDATSASDGADGADGGEDGAAGDGGEDPGPLAPVVFAVPLAHPEQFNLVIGVDHDPDVHDDEGALGRTVCQDYNGRSFPYCYDEHNGSDYIMQGGFSTMDDGSVQILAGAAGTVSVARDGNYDRCHADASGVVDCDGHDMVANAVVIEHQGTDGQLWRSKYWHMKKDSVAVVVGQEVEAGAVLGLVGSSGNSSMPHLHFQLEVMRTDDTGIETDWILVDPYAGPLSQDLSFWCSQGPEDGMPGGC